MRVLHSKHSGVARVLASLWGLIVYASACTLSRNVDSEEFIVEVEGERAVGPSWTSYRARAVQNGDGSFIAEGDIVFRDEESLRQHYEDLRLEEPSSKLAVMQRTTTGFEPTFEGADALDISYCVSTFVPNHATVVQDMAIATRDWSNNAYVKFRYDPSKDASCTPLVDVDFAVVPITTPRLAGCAANRLMWPAAAGGCASGEGVLEVQYSERKPGTTGPGLLRHELGHILGFRHEHPWGSTVYPCDEEQVEVGQELGARRLTAYDQQSVMHYPDLECGGIPNRDWTISTLDQRGAVSVYGIPAAWYVAIL